MDNSTQQKQHFLRTEILQAGYNPELFIAFMHRQTQSETINIQGLSLNQLQKLVKQYKKQVEKDKDREREKQSGENGKEENSHKEKKESSKAKIIYVKQTVKQDKYAPVFDFQLVGTVNCVECADLSKGQLQISVPQYETKEIEGFFLGIGAKTQYYYHIKTNLINGVVKRLSEDFDWLCETITKLYPFLSFPELEGLRKDIENPYQKRRQDIEEYLKYLADKDHMKYSQLFIDFLTLSTDKMQKYKKSYDSMGFAKGASLMKNAKGFVYVELTNKARSFFKDSKQFTRKITSIHQKINHGITKMIQSFNVAIESTYHVVDFFAQLHDAYADLNNKYPSLKKQEYSDILVNMNNLFLGIGDSLRGSQNLIEKYAKQYFRFNSRQDKDFHRLQKTVKQAQNQYLEYKYNLSRKKQRIISDPSKWELEGRKVDTSKYSKDELKEMILPRQTLSESELKCWYAFSLKNYQSEFHDYLIFSTKRYSRVYKQFATQLLNSDKNYLEALTSFIAQMRKY